MKIRKNKLDHEEDTATSQGRSSSSNIPYNWRLFDDTPNKQFQLPFKCDLE